MTAASEAERAPEALVEVARDDVDRAVAAGVIRADQAEPLWRFLKEKPAAPDAAVRPRFDLVHLLWYAGALIVIGAMGLFTTLAFAQLGGAALAATAVIYAVILAVAGDRLWRRGLLIPGGLLITIAVTMAPLFVYGMQDALGWLHDADPGAYRGFYGFCRWTAGSRVPMALATVAGGLIALRFYRFAFLVAPIAAALWFMSMDLAPWILGEQTLTWQLRKLVSVWFGLGMVIVAWAVDLRSRGDFAFWLHLFGVLAFWGGLTALDSDSEIARFVHCLLNGGLVGLGLLLQRRAYALFGGTGIALYLHHLAGRVFEDSLLYPFALSLIGLAVIGAGLLLHRHGAALQQALQGWLPGWLTALRPPHGR